MRVEILSAAYSGSTLLDAILDSQPGFIGVGEAAQCWEKKTRADSMRGPCHICGCDARDCEFWRDYFTSAAGECPATWALRKTGERFVVDSSKGGHRFHPVTDLPRVQIFLVKAPHEWAASVLSHDGALFTLERAWSEWERIQAENLAYCKTHYDRPGSGPRYGVLHYSDLTRSTFSVMEEFSKWLGFNFDATPIRNGSMWHRKSHALGGNPAVIDQLSKTDQQTGGRQSYLGGKYMRGPWRNIRYDAAWSENQNFCRQCSALYAEADDKMRGLLEVLRFPTAERLAQQLYECSTIPGP